MAFWPPVIFSVRHFDRRAINAGTLEAPSMPATAPSPLELVEQPAFRVQLVKHVTLAYRQGRVKRADIDDIVQQIWALVFVRIATFQPERGPSTVGSGALRCM